MGALFCQEDVSLLDEEIEEEESEEEEEPTTLSFRHGREGDEEDGPEVMDDLTD